LLLAGASEQASTMNRDIPISPTDEEGRSAKSWPLELDKKTETESLMVQPRMSVNYWRHRGVQPALRASDLAIE